MNLDRILGQHDLKDKIYSSIKKKTYPQSKIIIDKENVLEDIAPKMVLKESKDDKTA